MILFSPCAHTTTISTFIITIIASSWSPPPRVHSQLLSLLGPALLLFQFQLVCNARNPWWQQCYHTTPLGMYSYIYYIPIYASLATYSRDIHPVLLDGWCDGSLCRIGKGCWSLNGLLILEGPFYRQRRSLLYSFACPEDLTVTSTVYLPNSSLWWIRIVTRLIPFRTSDWLAGIRPQHILQSVPESDQRAGIVYNLKPNQHH